MLIPQSRNLITRLTILLIVELVLANICAWWDYSTKFLVDMFYKKPPKTYLNLHHVSSSHMFAQTFRNNSWISVDIDCIHILKTHKKYIAFSYKPYYNTTVNYNNIKWSESEKNLQRNRLWFCLLLKNYFNSQYIY